MIYHQISNHLHLFWTLFLCVPVYNLSAQPTSSETSGEYLYKTFEKNNQVLNYRIMYPHDFDKSASYPLVVFLHGMGERGTDNETQLTHGSKLFQDSLKNYPAIVIFPQCPPTDYWANLSRPDTGGRDRVFTFHTDQPPRPTLQLVIELMDEMIAQSFVDDERVYLSGLSMGAFGVWELLWRIPEKIAVALPICGGGPASKGLDMVDVPVWIFHGIKDDVVHPRFSIMMMKSIQKAGGKAKITLYPEANHNSWDPAFAEPDFLRWMFSKKRKAND